MQLRPPPLVPTQMAPSRSSYTGRTTSFDRPSLEVIVVKKPSFRRTRPPPVPIHRLPSLSSKTAKTRFAGSPFFASYELNLPSLRRFNLESKVPTQTVPAASSNTDQ